MFVLTEMPYCVLVSIFFKVRRKANKKKSNQRKPNHQTVQRQRRWKLINSPKNQLRMMHLLLKWQVWHLLNDFVNAGKCITTLESVRCVMKQNPDLVQFNWNPFISCVGLVVFLSVGIIILLWVGKVDLELQLRLCVEFFALLLSTVINASYKIDWE